jgi:hypothetical protein
MIVGLEEFPCERLELPVFLPGTEEVEQQAEKHHGY